MAASSTSSCNSAASDDAATRHNKNNKVLKRFLLSVYIASILSNHMLSEFDTETKSSSQISSMNYDQPQQQQQQHPSLSFSPSRIQEQQYRRSIDVGNDNDNENNNTTDVSKDINTNNNNSNKTTTTMSSKATTTATTTRKSMPHSILFIHIGKSGGQSLKYALKVGCQTLAERVKKRECKKNLPTSEISNKVQGYKHVTKLSGNIHNITQDVDGFLIVLRHPLDRFVSWYNYINPNLCLSRKVTPVQCQTESQIRNSQSTIQLKRPIPNLGKDFFYGCFPTIQNITTLFTTTTDDGYNHQKQNQHKQPKLSFAPSCIHLIKKVLEGNFNPNNLSEIFGHMIYNIQRYINIIPQLSELQQQQQQQRLHDNLSSNTTTTTTTTTGQQHQRQQRNAVVYVVRTEYLWDDMKHIDQLLGGNGNFGHVDGLQVTHYNSTTTTTHHHIINVNNETKQQRQTQSTLQAEKFHNNNNILLPIHVRKRICCLLQKEMILYHDLLVLWSDNLTTEQSTTTWQNAIKHCGGGGDDNDSSLSLSWDDYFNEYCLNDALLLKKLKID